jgi:hypothetical protein
MSHHMQFIMKDPLVQYYHNQAGRGSPNGIGPVYAVQNFI